MISRDRIISASLKKLGEVSSYNDNRSDVYKLADSELDDLLDYMASTEKFTFNAVTIPLTLNINNVNELGEYRYNLPNDFLNKISFIDSTGRLENEFIYSTNDKVFLRYCRRIDLSDYPEYLKNYLVYALASSLAEDLPQYNSKIPLLNTLLDRYRLDVYKTQFTPIVKSYL